MKKIARVLVVALAALVAAGPALAGGAGLMQQDGILGALLNSAQTAASDGAWVGKEVAIVAGAAGESAVLFTDGDAILTNNSTARELLATVGAAALVKDRPLKVYYSGGVPVAFAVARP